MWKNKELIKFYNHKFDFDNQHKDNYDDWLNVGFVLKSIGDDKLKLWKKWSKQSDKYEEDCCEYQWNRMVDSGGYTIKSLYYWTKKDN